MLSLVWMCLPCVDHLKNRLNCLRQVSSPIAHQPSSAPSDFPPPSVTLLARASATPSSPSTPDASSSTPPPSRESQSEGVAGAIAIAFVLDNCRLRCSAAWTIGPSYHGRVYSASSVSLLVMSPYTAFSLQMTCLSHADVVGTRVSSASRWSPLAPVHSSPPPLGREPARQVKTN